MPSFFDMEKESDVKDALAIFMSGGGVGYESKGRYAKQFEEEVRACNANPLL